VVFKKNPEVSSIEVLIAESMGGCAFCLAPLQISPNGNEVASCRQFSNTKILMNLFINRRHSPVPQ